MSLANTRISRTFFPGGNGASRSIYDPSATGVRLVSSLPPRTGSGNSFRTNPNFEAGSFRNAANVALGNRSLANNITFHQNGGSLNTNMYPDYYNITDPRLNYNPIIYPNGYPGYAVERPVRLVYGNGFPYTNGYQQSYNPYTYALPLYSPTCAQFAGSAALGDPVSCWRDVVYRGGTPKCAQQVCGNL